MTILSLDRLMTFSCSKSNKANIFGAMIPMTAAGQAAAASLGMKFYRNITTFSVVSGVTTQAAVTTANGAGYKLVLTIRNSPGDGAPATDLVAYANFIDAVCANYTPWGIAIENEENLLSMYTGTTAQYTAQLTAAKSVAASYGTKVLNGGLSSKGLLYMIWDRIYGGYPNAGAEDFARRAFSVAEAQALINNTIPAPIVAMLARTEALYDTYAASAIDYANFHFYVEASEYGDNHAVMEEAASYVRALGKPIICNEWGIRVNDPTLVYPLMYQHRQDRVQAAIYFSPAPAAGYDVYELQNDDGTLTAFGLQYADYITQYRLK